MSETDADTVDESLVSYASEACEAIRTINHKTVGGVAIPAPSVYNILGNGRALGYALQQALQQIGAGLVPSLDEYNLREGDGSDPAINTMTVQNLMNQAVEHAGQIGRLLQEAQDAING